MLADLTKWTTIGGNTNVKRIYFLQGLPEVEVKRGKPRFFTPDVKTPAYLAEVEVKNIGRGNYLVGVEVENNSEVIYLAEVEVKKCFRGFYLAWVEV